MAFLAPHHAPTAALQVSSYATYVAAGTILTGAMLVGTRSLLGYDQNYDLHADVLEYLDNYIDRDRRRPKPSYYVDEIHKKISYLPQLGDLAMYLPEEPEDEHHPVEHEPKSTSALAATSPVSTLFSHCLLIMGMAKTLATNFLWNAAIGSATYILILAFAALAIVAYHATTRFVRYTRRAMQIVEAIPILFQLLITLPNHHNQRKEDLTLMLKVIEGLVTKIACLRSGSFQTFGSTSSHAAGNPKRNLPKQRSRHEQPHRTGQAAPTLQHAQSGSD